MHARFRILLLVTMATGLGACGSARIVQRNQGGGILALQGERNEAMKDAHVKMAGHCGVGQYTVTQESEEVVGTATSNQEEQKTTKKGTVVNEGTTKTLNVTEWRMVYQCGAAPANAYAGYPQPPPPGYPAPAQPGQPYPPPPAAGYPQPAPPPGYGAAPPAGYQPAGGYPPPPQGYPQAPPQGYPQAPPQAPPPQPR